MAVVISGEYLGDKKVKAVHGPSGTELRTAAPIDNQGDGSSFSPTDLAAASMATCMLTIMGIAAEKHGVDLTGATFRIEKHMNASPRYIKAMPVIFHLPSHLSDDMREVMKEAAYTCPVHRSFDPKVSITIDFNFDV
ncbi:MAG: OsmC family protein [Bdellovibrionales bacterium]|nr:OsmC family protein [Bdellovibrionales bacterium]